MQSKAKLAKKLPGPRRKLTAKQVKWRDHYLVHRNGTQASLHAGCPAKSASSYGSVLLKNPLIQKALAEYDFEKTYPKAVDKGWIIQQLHKSYDTYQKKNASSAVRCLEQLIKLSDFDPDKSPGTSKGKNTPASDSGKFNDMTTEEKLDELRRTTERIAESVKRAGQSGSKE